ncbi:MAG TPA: hypothetical protein VM076_24550 [Gemmatimonadaceae bacterium]|nr:hypothetical protein [Gemmatimonadaceae bacterium]
MTRFVSVVALLMLAACHRATYRWQPTLVSQVPDSMTVQFRAPNESKTVIGRSLGWQTMKPRVITPRGDTLVVPDASRMSVKAKGKTGHPLAGALIGWAVGTGVMLAHCGQLMSYCGEQDPTSLLTAGAGALIGATIRTDRWVRLKWGPK